MTMHSVSSLLLLASLTTQGTLAAYPNPPDGYTVNYGNFGDATPVSLVPRNRGSSGDQFGMAVSIYEDLAAVASREAWLNGKSVMNTRGRVHLYHRGYLFNQWEESNEIFISGTDEDDGYGTSVALHSSILIIGAPKNDNNRGLAYVYWRNPDKADSIFRLQDALELEKGGENDFFGQSVAIIPGTHSASREPMVVVGAYGHNHDDAHKTVGCVQVFAMSYASWSGGSWKSVGVLEASEPVDNGGFGYSVAAYGNTVAVGSYGSDRAHVFEVHGHLHDCPHQDPEHEDENVPSECQSSSRRQLRALHEPEHEERQQYTEWKYEEVLAIGFENKHDPAHKDDDDLTHFGASVAVYNNSGLVTVAVGCTLCQDSSYQKSGAVYIFSKLAQSDLVYGWKPDGYDEHHHRLLQEGDHKEEERRHQLWNPSEASSHAAQDKEFWILENQITGTVAKQRYGYSIAIDNANMLVGDHPTSYNFGHVHMYSRVASTNNRDIVVSGPLYDTMWTWKYKLQHQDGINSDQFGYSVALYQNEAIVGSIYSGVQSDKTLGAGGAYIYSRLSLTKIVTDTSDSSGTDAVVDTSISSKSGSATVAVLLGLEFFIAFFVVCCGLFAVYKVSGGEKSFPQMVQNILFGSTTDNRPKTTTKKIHLTSAMDDSTSTIGSSHGLVPGGLGSSGSRSAYSGLDGSSGSNHPRPVGNFRQQQAARGSPRVSTPQSGAQGRPVGGQGRPVSGQGRPVGGQGRPVAGGRAAFSSPGARAGGSVIDNI